MVGTRFGPYLVTAAIGAGGMGEVYRAHDTRLDRDVALKVLPTSFTDDPDRLARFDREAHVLASLNHPNIAHVYGLEQSADGRRAIVMELVDGLTLADRLAAGPMPLDETLPVIRQIALALEAAHEQGIVHRDLKPANIKVRDDGTVKVLDFGLAKAVDPSGTPGAPSNSPTLTNRATQLGVILGTAAYMAPEQAKGKAIDKRADIWSFGVVLYELLSGRRAFDADDVSDTLAAVLTRDVDWKALPPDVPARLKAIVADCLVRDPKQRLRDIGDARIALDRLSNDVPPPAPPQARDSRLPWLAAGGFALTTVALAFGLTIGRPSTSADTPLRRFAVARPGNAWLVVSPDGQYLLAYRQLAPARFRRVDSPDNEWRELAGTADGAGYFWSPDSRHIGFGQADALKTIDLQGSKPQVLCRSCIVGTNLRGGTWSREGVIVFSDASGKPLRMIAAEGGEPRAVTELDAGRQEVEHLFPSFLPDGRRFLYVARTNNGNHSIMLGSIDGGPPKRVVSSFTRMAYAGGYLLFGRDGSLLAQPFDADRGVVSGDPVVIEKSIYTPTGGAADFSVSNEGTLISTSEEPASYWWVDRTGKRLERVDLPPKADSARVSPDESRLLVGLIDSEYGSDDIYVVNRGGDGRARLTFDPEWDMAPVWSPDGTRALFKSQRIQHKNAIYVRAADGSSPEALVVVSDNDLVPGDWSPDGRHVLIGHRVLGKSWDIMSLTMPEGSITPWRATEFQETHPRFSPRDGKWVAYDSDETGSPQVYVRSFPDGALWRRVTTAGGRQPVWSRDGKELFYVDERRHVMSAAIRTSPALDVGTPQEAFPAASDLELGAPAIDIDGHGRFLLRLYDRKPEAPTASIVLNWPKLIKK